MTGSLRLATWNVNSIRARAERVVDFLRRSNVDVLAIQETKVADAGFPGQEIEALGYQIAHHGLNQWNGVAVLSRVGLDDVMTGFPGIPSYGEPPVTEARALSAVCAGVRVWSVYVPNGREIDHPHYHYKLDWLTALARYGADQLAADQGLQMAFCGDYNIAPTDADVWSVEYYLDKTHTTPRERAAFQAVVDAGYSDVVRAFTSEPRTFTYWDYQQLRFPKNRGMRIDFVLASAALAARVTSASIDREERKGKGASDHAPVIVEFGG
jgi:exodeoxyribonuclease-3